MGKPRDTASMAALRNNAVGPLVRDGGRKKAGSTRLWLMTGGVLLASLEAATESFAIHFRFQLALGPLHIGPVYQPFSIIGWALTYGTEFQNPLKIAGFVGTGVFLAGAAMVGAHRKRAEQKSVPDHFLHGSARWADKFDIEQASLLHNPGVYLGGWIDPKTNQFYFLRHDGAQHIICFGPTRSGKGVGPVLTTLWSWHESMVVNDPKGELSQMTRAHRETALNNTILLLDFASRDCLVGWNVFEEIRVGTDYETADVQNICSAIIDSDGSGFDDGVEGYFKSQARDYLIGVVLHSLYQHRTGRDYLLKDEAGQAVAKLAENDMTFTRFVDGQVDADNKPIAASLVEFSVKAGDPLPLVGKDGCVRALAQSEAILLYKTRLETRGVGDPRFRTRPVIDGDAIKRIVVSYNYQKVTFRDAAPPPSPGFIEQMLTDVDEDASTLWNEMQTFEHFPSANAEMGVGPAKRTHRIVAQAARQVLEMGDSDEIKSTLSTAKKAFGLYKDAIVSRNTSRSTFKIEDLMYGQTPTTLYIITQEADKERLRPLTRVLLALMVRMLTPKQVIVDGELIKTFNQRLLFLIDEFPDLGRIDAIESILATAAGFGLKFMFFAQGIPQLRVPKKGYGPDETITLGCQVKIFFTPADDRTAEIVSKATGETTVVNKEVTVSGKKGLFGGDTSVSTSYSQNKRVLLTEDEVLRLPSGVYDKNDPLKLVEPGDTLIQVTGRPMIYGKQILYWDYPYFLDAKATKTPPDQNYVRVAWFDRLGNPRHSLMRQADADELCRALEADLAATPPPVGIGNRWAPPGSAPLGSIDGADMSNHGPVLGGSAPGAAVSALSVSPSALFARPGGQGSSPPPRSIKR